MPDPDAARLLDRRAALLRADGIGLQDELDEVTDALRDVLGRDEPAVRRLSLADPDELIERIAAAEPVHPVSGRADLADRLDVDRRCFVLEHPALPGRPMNVVWVALWNGIAGDVAEILDPDAPTSDPRAADTAVLYSIWAAEPGLQGLPGGPQLIEGAIRALGEELPAIRSVVTLSPIPGFRQWWAHEGGPVDDLLSDDETVLQACLRYLMSRRVDGRPLDPVARFHLGNGARLLSLQRHGDRSENGQARSWAVMANYRYVPEDRAANRAALEDGDVALGPSLSAVRSTARR